MSETSDDMPEDVWQRARDHCLRWGASVFSQRMVAHAILEAEQRGAEREREACAQLAASFDERTDILKILGAGVAGAIRRRP